MYHITGMLHSTQSLWYHSQPGGSGESGYPEVLVAETQPAGLGYAHTTT